MVISEGIGLDQGFPNLTVEGSLDSLYEAVEDCSKREVYSIPTRSQSHNLLLGNKKCHTPQRFSLTEFPNANAISNQTKRGKDSISTPCHEALDNAFRTDAPPLWLSARHPEDLCHIRNDDKQGLGSPLKERNHRTTQENLLSNNSKPIEIISYDDQHPTAHLQTGKQRDSTTTNSKNPKGTSGKSQLPGKKGSGNDKQRSASKHTGRGSKRHGLDTAAAAAANRSEDAALALPSFGHDIGQSEGRNRRAPDSSMEQQSWGVTVKGKPSCCTLYHGSQRPNSDCNVFSHHDLPPLPVAQDWAGPGPYHHTSDNNDRLRRKDGACSHASQCVGYCSTSGTV
ncbi:uncharacterized protein LOC134454842 [Engraulis encrasicolus]|uniref:uncharacterized protein LOC134454842 n=1 Tax=Engraulis encrasicolus TaxID=184585 RepID=UPI002FD1BCCB